MAVLLGSFDDAVADRRQSAVPEALSGVPPGGNGTMKRIAFDGYCWAAAAGANSVAAASSASAIGLCIVIPPCFAIVFGMQASNHTSSG
jgi:hypothetical protein